MLQPIKIPPIRQDATFLFSRTKVEADGCRERSNTTELATVSEFYSPPDALGQVERLCGCPIVSLLRVDSDSNQEDDVMLHNSQLRVALTELLGVHHQCASQGGAMKRIIQQMMRELTSMRQQNATRPVHSLACSDPSAPGAETAALKEAWARMNAYSQQAAASQLAVDEARLESKRLRTQLDASSQAHALEQRTLNNELQQLQERCAKLEMRASDLSDRAITAERELLFAREQLGTRTTQADASQVELRGQLDELQQASSASADQAAAAQQALSASDRRCADLQADLKCITIQLEEALSKIKWYEERLSTATPATSQSTADAVAAAASKDSMEQLGSGKQLGHGSPTASSPTAADGHLLRPLRVPTATRSGGSRSIVTSSCEPQATPFSPSSMPLALAGAQQSTGPRPSPMRPRSETRSFSPDVPLVASFGRGPMLEGGIGSASIEESAQCAAGTGDCTSPKQTAVEVATHARVMGCETAGAPRSAASRQPFAEVGNRTHAPGLAPSADGLQEIDPAQRTLRSSVGVGSDYGDASLDAWTRGTTVSGAGQARPQRWEVGEAQRSVGMQAGQGAADAQGGAARAANCGRSWEGRPLGEAAAPCAELSRSGDSEREVASLLGGASSEQGASAAPVWPNSIRPDESARSSASGSIGGAAERGPATEGLRRELRREKMRNEALLFALQQARDGGAGAAGPARHSTHGGSPSCAVQAVDVGCQMVFNHVFGLDAIIQCNLGAEDLAGIKELGCAAGAWTPVGVRGGPRTVASQGMDACRPATHGITTEQKPDGGMVFELPDDIDLLLEDEPEWETLVASLSDLR